MQSCLQEAHRLAEPGLACGSHDHDSKRLVSGETPVCARTELGSSKIASDRILPTTVQNRPNISILETRKMKLREGTDCPK